MSIRLILAFALVALAACGSKPPPAPTSAQPSAGVWDQMTWDQETWQ